MTKKERIFLKKLSYFRSFVKSMFYSEKKYLKKYCYSTSDLAESLYILIQSLHSVNSKILNKNK